MSKRNEQYPIDDDGVRVVAKAPRTPPGRWLFVVAVVVLVGVVASRFFFGGSEPALHQAAVDVTTTPEQPVVGVAPTAVAHSLRAHEPLAASAGMAVAVVSAVTKPAGRVARVPQPVGATEESKRVEALVRDMVDAARASGETTGIAAFPPAGTDPIKVGLVVPEDYELPPGFIRYHQVTDDGRRIEPILAFSPDYELVDAGGHPVPVPDDGIVPPEMAPADLPRRTLEVPKDPYGAR